MKAALIMAIVGIGLSTPVLSDEARADGFSVSVWQNNTNYTVGGSYRWGNGRWQSFSILPGRGFSTWYPQDQGNPPLQIRFDADPGPGNDQHGYRLRTYYSPTTIFNRGATEVFVVLPNGRVDLRRNRP